MSFIKDQKKQFKLININNGILYNDNCIEVLKHLENNTIDCVITSPPYWSLRDYGVDGQIGLEEQYTDYIDKLLSIFREIKWILKDSGSCYVNLGETYHNALKWSCKKELPQTISKGKNRDFNTKKNNKQNIPKKCLMLIPDRFAISMIEDGWILRNVIIWHKPNQLPQSVKDRFTHDYEKIFFFVKNRKYYFEQQFEPLKEESKKGILYNRNGKISKKNVEVNRPGNNPHSFHKIANSKSKIDKNNVDKMIKEGKTFLYPNGMRNKRSVWSVPTKAFKDAHFAVFPEDLVEPLLLAGCPENGIVLDPFMWSGTTAVVAEKNNRKWVGIELNTNYCNIITNRIKKNDKHQPELFNG